MKPTRHHHVLSRIGLRAILLFLFLGGIKLALLGSLAGHLFYTHWRVDTPAPTWVDFTGYYLFVLLGPLTLVLVGRALGPAEVKATRWLNAGFVAAGLLLVLLSFHRMKHNYLYPVLTGVLGPVDVWQYLKMDLFFERPFLSLYLFGYALVYWVLLRTKREAWSFYILGGMAALYLVLNLREWVLLGRQLLAIDCVGLAGFVSWRVMRAPLDWKWQAWPMLLATGGWAWFASMDHLLLRPGASLVILFSLSLVLLALANVFVRRTTAFPLCSHFLPFYWLAFFMLANQYYPLAGNYTHAALFGLALGHYFWQEAVLAGVLFVMFRVLYGVLPRISVRLFDAVIVLLVLAGMIDWNLTRNMGFRLDWQALVVCNNVVLLWRTVEPYAGRLALALLGFGVIYLGLLFTASRMQLTGGKVGQVLTRPWVCFPGICLMLVGALAPALVGSDKAEGLSLTHLVTTSPLATGWKVKKLTPAEFERTAPALQLGRFPRPALPVPSHPAPPRDLNVFLIVMESSYNRYLSLFGAADETQPRLKQYRDRMELFPNFYANFVNSLNARFTVVSGLYPCLPYVTYVTSRIEAPSLFDIFHDRGYRVSLFDSCYRDYQRWNDYLIHRKIDCFYDAGTMPGREKFKNVSWGVSEDATRDAIKDQLARHARNKERFFISYMPVAPHMPYDAPSKEFEKFDNGAGFINNDYTGRYKNQLLYMDWIITSLLDELARLDLLEKTLVVITNDHGEMVGEDDHQLGHGWNLEPPLANVPLIIMDPQKKGGRVNLVLGSHVDILPTILDLLNLPLPGGELYQGTSLYDSETNSAKVVYLSSHRPRAIIKGSRYILEDAEGGSARAGRSVRVYEISHQGVKTNFRLLDDHPPVKAELDQFERFQKSFLVHYAYYRDLARKAGVSGEPGRR